MHHFFASFAEMLQKRRYAYSLLILIHFIMICFTFQRHIFAPKDTMFTVWGDGLKNYFTLVTYVKEPIGKDGIFKYDHFNYPYGDYVYATDNTPLFSIPFRWFCQHIYDLSDYSIAFFNFFIIGNILLTGLLVFFIFKRLLNNTLIAWLLALFLPWINFQVTRIFNSHYNLSLTAFPLIAIALFMLWHRYRDKLLAQAPLALAMILFSCCCFFAHGYYVAIIPVFMSAMLFFYGLYRIRSKTGVISVIAAVLVSGMAAALAFGIMQGTDRYLDLRQDFAMGYDWMEQKTNFSLLFTHYSFQNVFFPMWMDKSADGVELMVYLGNIGLYAMALLFLVSLFNRKFRLTLLSIQKDFFSSPLYAGIFFGGLLMLSMSFGENYYPMMDKLRVSLPFRTEGRHMKETVMVLAGGICLAIMLFLFLRSKEKMNYTPMPVRDKRNTLIRSVLFYVAAAAVLYAIFGHYDIGHIVNRTNPLFILHQFTRKVEQFRSLARFAWPFYWTFYIWIMYTVAGVYRLSNQQGKQLIVALILLLGSAETIDLTHRMKDGVNHPSYLTNNAESKSLEQLKINFKDYQAILPVPYYNIGSEDYNYTIDDLGEFSPFTYQLSLYSSLPLMSCKLSRTPPRFSQELLALITNDSVSTELKQLLNDKPILVAMDRKFLHDSSQTTIPDIKLHPVANAAYWKSYELPERNHLEPVDSLGTIYFYAWKPEK